MFLWAWISVMFLSIAIVLGIKLVLLYRDIRELGAQFDERLQNDTNNVIYVSGNDKQIKAFAKQLNRALEALYDKRRIYQNGDRELKEAVTNISHDLRTPLTAIYGYLDLLDAKLETDNSCCVFIGEKEIQYLRQIRNRADAMRALTEELFRYSIVLSQSQDSTNFSKTLISTDTNRETVSLNRFLADYLLSYYDIFQQNHIEPEITITDKEVVRVLDTRALKRIFGNILDNAVKYSRPAKINNSTEFAKTKLSVMLSAEGTIIFRNSAQNLDRVSVERLFDRFYTVETGKNSTGLGLSIAKYLTERIGGKISAAYIEGELAITLQFTE